MSKKEWGAVGAVAGLGAAVVAYHGLTSKRWTELHSVLVVVGAVAAVATNI